MRASQVPISVKMRLGTGGIPDTALEITERLESEGVIRVCVHGRTLKQRYSGTADWDSINQIVKSVSIPVIANGDVSDAKSAESCLKVTGAAGLMIGRAAIGRPMIFHTIKKELGWTEEKPPWQIDDPIIARLWCWERYLTLCHEVYGELGVVRIPRGMPSHSRRACRSIPQCGFPSIRPKAMNN